MGLLALGMNDSNAICNPDSPWWAKLLDRFGVSTCMLIALVYAIYLVAMWLALNVITPITSSHMELLRATRDATAQQAIILLRVESAIEDHNDTMSDLMKLNSNILKVVQVNQEMQTELLVEIQRTHHP